MQRQVRQQRADIDLLYELVSVLDVKVDRRLDELGGQLAKLLRQFGDRWPVTGGAARGHGFEPPLATVISWPRTVEAVAP